MHLRLTSIVGRVLAIAGLTSLSLVGIIGSAQAAGTPAAAPKTHVPVCSPTIAPGEARCFAHRRTDPVGTPAAHNAEAAQPAVTMTPFVIGNNGAYDPAYLRSAYNLTQISPTAGAGQIVAIVDAYDAPNAESDLATYRTRFGLTACTTANGCFSKVNESGVQGSYPAADSGWAQEISLDVDMVSAICPNCKILLVEANSNSLADLGTAVNTAARLGANAISNSYGGQEFSVETSYEQADYYHPGIAVTVSSGDSGYGVEFPAASQYVTAVGGTTLNQASNGRGWSETAWSGAGAGCSAFISKPAWQKDTGCSNRTVADVSAVADPNTGVWVYDGGWYVFGGTSVASPIVASVYALAGNSTVNFGSYPYKTPSALWDAVGASDGSCGGSYLCTAVSGYDGPTGLGTPNGTNAFKASNPPPPPSGGYSIVGNPSTLSPVAGHGSSVGLTLTTSSGYNSTVSLAVKGLPSGATATFSTNPVTPSSGGASSTLKIETATTTPGGVYTLIVTGTGSDANATQASTTLTLNVQNYTVSVTPSSMMLTQGSTSTATVTVTSSGGYNYQVALSASGLPSGVTASFSPGSITPTSSGATSTLTLTADRSTTAGSYTLTVTGVGAYSAGGRSVASSLTVRPAATYTITGSPSSVSPVAGHGSGYELTLASSDGYNSPVTLSVGGLPPGVTASFGSNPLTPSSAGTSTRLSVETSATTPGGVYTLTVTGTGSDASAVKASTTLTLDVQNYTVAASPQNVTVARGSSTADTVTVTSSGGYTYPVSLAASGLPAGVTASFSPTSVTPTSSGATSMLTLTAASTVTPGTYTVTVTGAGTYAAAGRSTTLTLVVK